MKERVLRWRSVRIRRCYRGGSDQPLVGTALVEEWEEVGGAMAQAADMLNRPLEVDFAASGGATSRKFAGAIGFEDVTFTYSGARGAGVERKFGFSVPAGTMLGPCRTVRIRQIHDHAAVLGINREYTGFVKIDGADLRGDQPAAFAVEFWCRLAGPLPVPQPDPLRQHRARTSRTDARGCDPRHLAGAEEFIERMPNGYETYIEEGSPSSVRRSKAIWRSPGR